MELPHFLIMKIPPKSRAPRLKLPPLPVHEKKFGNSLQGDDPRPTYWNKIKYEGHPNTIVDMFHELTIYDHAPLPTSNFLSIVSKSSHLSQPTYLRAKNFPQAF